jgi:hypothetical protein
MFSNSRDADVNVLALSDIKVAGNPNRLTNLRKLLKNDGTVRSGGSSRWIALVEAQAYKQTYVFSDETASCASPFFETYRGPKKSRPCNVRKWRCFITLFKSSANPVIRSTFVSFTDYTSSNVLLDDLPSKSLIYAGVTC